MVGMTGFEPATSASRTQRSTKLSYIPIECHYNMFFIPLQVFFIAYNGRGILDSFQQN